MFNKVTYGSPYTYKKTIKYLAFCLLLMVKVTCYLVNDFIYKNLRDK